MSGFSIHDLTNYLEVLVAALPILVYLARKIHEYTRTRDLRRFWKPFMGNSLSVIFPVYDPGNARFEELQKTTVRRWLVSEGMAFSLAELLDFCKDYITKRQNIDVFGDNKKLEPRTKGIVLLGSPAVNHFSAARYHEVADRYEMPYRIDYDEPAVDISIAVTGTDVSLKLEPDFTGRFWEDYCLIIKCRCRQAPERWVVMIFGCHMWGTQAGTTAVTDLSILNEVNRYTDGAPNVAFIVKTHIVNSTPTGPELDIGNRRFIQALKEKGR